MASFLIILISGPDSKEQGVRALEGIATAHALAASGMAKTVEILLSGAGVEWLARLATGTPDDTEAAAPLREAMGAGVAIKVCTRAVSERGGLEGFDAVPEVTAAGAPTLIATRAAAGWTLLTY